jgi:hypothetical protein
MVKAQAPREDTMNGTTMTETEARMFREAWNAAVKRYHRMTKAQLATEYRAALADQGTVSLYGGPRSKDELERALLDARGYTTAKLNETTHILYHEQPWPDCPMCATRIPTGTGWPGGVTV